MSRDIGQKLRRLLFIVPYVAKHADGVPVDKLAALMGTTREAALEDLDLLAQVGPPDGDPGEYLLVAVEDGRVFVDLPHRLTRPLRLTPAEGCSLLLGIRALRDSGIAPFDEAMAAAERKLLGAMGRDAEIAESLATSTVVGAAETVVTSLLPRLVTATRERVYIEIDYVSASRHQGERRRVAPYGLVHHAGEWYLVGYCAKRGDVRTFRIDRIATLEASVERFDVPASFDLEAYRRDQLYVPSADAVAVRVHLDPLAVNRVGANWPVGELTMHPDGAADIVIDCEGFEWVTGWVLGLGRHAWIVGPTAARQEMQARLRRLRDVLPAQLDRNA